MNFHFVAFISFLLFFHHGFSQTTKKQTLKDKILNSEPALKIKAKLDETVAMVKKDYAAGSFNFTVAVSDNAGLFEALEQYKKFGHFILEVKNTLDGTESTKELRASAQNGIGEMSFMSSHYKIANLAFNRGLKLLQNDSTLAMYSQLMANKGQLLHTTGQYTQAEIFTLKAAALRKKYLGDTSLNYAASLNNLGVLYKDMGLYKEAEDNLRKAIEITGRGKSKQTFSYSLLLNNQAMLYYSMGRTDEAIAQLKTALELNKKKTDTTSTNYVRLMINLALMYQDAGRFAEAETLYKKCIKIKESKLSLFHPDTGHLLNLIASLYAQMGKYAEAERDLKIAIEIYKLKLGVQHPAYATSIYNLGNLYRYLGNVTESEKLLKESIAIRQTQLGEKHPETINALEALGILYWKSGRWKEAAEPMTKVVLTQYEFVSKFFPGMSESEKSKYWDKINPKILRFYGFAVEYGTQDPELLKIAGNVRIATKAILLNASTRLRHAVQVSNDELLKLHYANWQIVQEQLAHAYSLSKEELETEDINIDSLAKVNRSLEISLSERSALFSGDVMGQEITLEKVASALGPKEAAVEMIRFPVFTKTFTDSSVYAALVITQENKGVPALVTLPNGSALEKKYFAFYKNCIKQQVSDGITYSKYWAPIADKLVGKSSLYFSPDGIYNQINILSLKKPDGDFVIDGTEAVLVTNIKEVVYLKAAQTQNTQKNALLIGNPYFGDKNTVAVLPGTEKEIFDIGNLLGQQKYTVTSLSGKMAEEAHLLQDKSFQLIHFSTHGFFVPDKKSVEQEKLFGISTQKLKDNPMLRSGLLLAYAEDVLSNTRENGILTAYEISKYDLSGTELAILSACETGLGEIKNGEGVFGLQRAFLVAGAKAILMSLWKVNDAATQQLMISFYQYYLSGLSRAQAFRKAQMDLKTSFPNPYYWGAFVMIE